VDVRRGRRPYIGEGTCMFGITASHRDFAKATKHMFAIAVEYSITTCLTEAAIPSFYKIMVSVLPPPNQTG
jgi:hypothetical protein